MRRSRGLGIAGREHCRRAGSEREYCGGQLTGSAALNPWCCCRRGKFRANWRPERIHLGVTGIGLGSAKSWLRGKARVHALCAELGFGHGADLIMAVPAGVGRRGNAG